MNRRIRRALSEVDAAFSELATVVIVAGAITLLFWRLRQPLVLGHLLAGLILSPYTPGPWVRGGETLKFLGNLGIVFLFFALGLEFSLRTRSDGPARSSRVTRTARSNRPRPRRTLPVPD